MEYLFKYAADPDLSYFRSPTLRIPWTRRPPLSCSPTEGCLSRMSRRPWKVNNFWIIFVAFAMYLIEFSRYYTGGNLNGVYFERCLKWFWVQYSWWDDVLFSPTIPSNLHWLNLANKMPCVLTGFQESFSSVIKLIIEPASLLELWC